MHFFREPADVVMTLDHMRRIAADRDAFDYVGIERALSEEMIAAVFARSVRGILSEQSLGGVFENLHKLAANDFPLFFGIDDASEQSQKLIRRVHVFQANVKVLLENARNHVYLARTQQPVV